MALVWKAGKKNPRAIQRERAMNNEQRNIQTRTLIDMSRRGQKQKKNIQASPQDTESPSHRRIGWLAPSYVGRWLVLLPPPCISRNSLSINFHSPFTCSSDANADIHKQIKVEVMNLKIRFLFSLLPNFIADSPLSVEVRKIKVCVYHANKTTPRECRLEVSLWISVLNVNCFVLSARFAYCTDSLFVIILSSLFLETSCSERVHVSDFYSFVYMQVLRKTWKHVLLARRSLWEGRGKRAMFYLSVPFQKTLMLRFFALYVWTGKDIESGNAFHPQRCHIHLTFLRKMNLLLLVDPFPRELTLMKNHLFQNY